MRIVDFDGRDVPNPDMGSGIVVPGTAVRKGAEPIDDVSKLAWSESDYEDVLVYCPLSKEDYERWGGRGVTG